MMPGLRKGLVRAALVGLMVSLASSCTLLSPVNIETSKSVLNQLPLSVPRRESNTATLLVLAPETNPIFNTTQMAYVTRPYQIDFYARHEWSATPAQMLQPLLLKTMENTRYFSEVLTPPYPGNYSFALRTQIVELTQDYTSPPAAAQLSLRVQLINGANGQVIASKGIELREPMQHETPYAGVVASNNAIAKALQEVAAFVLDEMNIVCCNK